MSPQERAQRLEGIRVAERRANAALRRLRALEAAYRADLVATTPECAPGHHVTDHMGDDFYPCRVCGRST